MTQETEKMLSALHKYGLLSCLWFGMSWVESVSCWNSYLILFLVWLGMGGHHTLYIAYHTLGRDLR